MCPKWLQHWQDFGEWPSLVYTSRVVWRAQARTILGQIWKCRRASSINWSKIAFPYCCQNTLHPQTQGNVLNRESFLVLNRWSVTFSRSKLSPRVKKSSGKILTVKRIRNHLTNFSLLMKNESTGWAMPGVISCPKILGHCRVYLKVENRVSGRQKSASAHL